MGQGNRETKTDEGQKRILRGAARFSPSGQNSCAPVSVLFTPPEATNTGPGFNRGYGGGARGCGFEERVWAYARIKVGHFL